MFFLLFLLDDIRIRIRISDKWIRIREAQKHMDPTDPDPHYCCVSLQVFTITVPDYFRNWIRNMAVLVLP
jgi:hypothetical protein